MNGAGAAGIAVTKLLLVYGFADVRCATRKERYMVVALTSILKNKKWRRITNRSGKKGDLAQAIVGADIFIGVSKAGLLTEDMVRSMGDATHHFCHGESGSRNNAGREKTRRSVHRSDRTLRFPNQANNVSRSPAFSAVRSITA